MSLYLALNFLVKKSTNNDPELSTPFASNLGFQVLFELDSKSKELVLILNSNGFVDGSIDQQWVEWTFWIGPLILNDTMVLGQVQNLNHYNVLLIIQ